MDGQILNLQTYFWRCVDTTNANYPFAGAWRSNVAKYVFIYTDALPSGANDQWGPDDNSTLKSIRSNVRS
jgi:hypothetical protein